MGDTYTAFTEGVPDVSPTRRGSIFTSPVRDVRSNARNYQTLETESAILAAREKAASLRDRETARVQGAGAIKEISALDPDTDPDYDVKVMDILERNPYATLDTTVSNILGTQGRIFERRQSERDLEDERVYDREESERRAAEMLIREDERIKRAANVQRDAELEDKIANLPSTALKYFDDYREAGEPSEKAYRKAVEDAENEEAVNSLLAAGVPEADIFGPKDVITGKPAINPKTKQPFGIVDADGRIDRRKLATLQGEATRRQEEKAKADATLKRQEADLEYNIKRRKEMEEDGTLTPEMKNALDTSIAEGQKYLDSQRGLTPKTGTGATEGKPAPRSDVLPSDKFIP